jgi:hypothetical protein
LIQLSVEIQNPIAAPTLAETQSSLAPQTFEILTSAEKQILIGIETSVEMQILMEV